MDHTSLNQAIRALQPQRVWHYFAEILSIPRPSKKEEKIAAWLMEFGKEQGLESIQDAIGNVIIRKPATPGMENRKTVVLQSHIDMVCEKNADVNHDFDKDPIVSYIDGEWVKATGTTLGADDGIGIAAQLAILEAKDIPHPPIECLFTVDEETGLSGAFGLDPDILQGKILLNLDSEDEGELFIGCAGGKDTVARMPIRHESTPAGMTAFEIRLTGLVGGHSGDDIHKGRANAVKLITRLLLEEVQVFGGRIARLEAGNLRNAIAREAFATVLYDATNVTGVKDRIRGWKAIFRNEYALTEPALELDIVEASVPAEVFEAAAAERLLRTLYACPHGVIAWSAAIPGFVETSTNLASVRVREGVAEITTSQRSSVATAKEDICTMLASVFALAGADYVHSDGYPGWTPDPNSEITRITAASYRRLFETEPKVLAIHAGLECGLIGEKYPGMDMISYGPTIKGAHSPDERLLIPTVQRFWDLTLDVLKNIPVKED